MKLADKIKGIGLPSIKNDIINIWGLEKIPIQQIKVKPFTFPLRLLTITCPNAQQNAPLKTSIAPKVLPSIEGVPSNIIVPIQAIKIPTICFFVGISFKKIAAVKIPKITSVCIRSEAVDVSKIFSPEKVRPYCKEAETKAI